MDIFFFFLVSVVVNQCTGLYELLFIQLPESNMYMYIWKRSQKYIVFNINLSDK